MEKKDKIRKAYMEYVLENGHTPPTFYIFAKKLKLTESELYEFYTSFEAIDSDLWLSFFVQAKNTIEQDPTYQGYTVREKLLAFYYTWIEILKANRSFVMRGYQRFKQPLVKHTPPVLRAFKESFMLFARDLVYEGRESKEVLPRPYLSSKYPDALWLNALYIFDFWVKDLSPNFEKTDTAIEKTVNTAFDLMGHSLVDSVFDLAKFVYQNR